MQQTQFFDLHDIYFINIFSLNQSLIQIILQIQSTSLNTHSSQSKGEFIVGKKRMRKNCNFFLFNGALVSNFHHRPSSIVLREINMKKKRKDFLTIQRNGNICHKNKNKKKKTHPRIHNHKINVKGKEDSFQLLRW